MITERDRQLDLLEARLRAGLLALKWVTISHAARELGVPIRLVQHVVRRAVNQHRWKLSFADTQMNAALRKAAAAATTAASL